ncbi:hypothetical protein [Rhizobium tumorigenes]|uniref:Uncharacterized protein n=1 Tax=Rhizobium tumorigenes TaxID=2041385 RepID=A0AAF1KGW1_9HYPH|nr:hypothetical protein [Rhizobium tumorigenes]WFR96093.1 hypothetical protein PR017_02785 [Rhizobium tumorigenes]
MKLGAVAATLILIQVASASAAERLMACRFIGGSDCINQFDDVDQIRIDAIHNLAELRVALTTGTEQPVNWVFNNRSSDAGNDTFSILETPGGTFGAGIHGQELTPVIAPKVKPKTSL